MPGKPSLLRPHTPAVRLDRIPDLAGRDAVGSTEVTGITLDSRLVAAGDLYVGLPGARAHGAGFAPQAIATGAVAVLTDPAGAELARGMGVPVIAVPDPRAQMADVAAAIYDHPARKMTMFAITGTNGKTTTAYLLAAALAELGRSTGVIGTLGFFLDGERLEGARTTVTTPESPDLQALLAVLAERGANAVAMEVSSHAMALRRADGVRFDVAGFTNLGRDHLDFHHTMEAYFEAKAQLFTPAHTEAAVVNIDDEWGRTLAARESVRLRTLAWEREADYRVVEAVAGRVRVAAADAEWDFTLGLPGDYNVRNAVTALAMLDLAGLDAAAASRGLAEVEVPGRMQRVRLGEDAPEVYVDFAHTPQAIAAALDSFAPARRAGRTVIAVLGCGGDRDHSKRRPMGAAAAGGADIVVITDDNPRSEDPAAIRAEAIAGAQAYARGDGPREPVERVIDGPREPVERVINGGDRRSAITTALRLAGSDGIVAILGKGHEQGQQIGETTHPFDDVAVTVERWAAIGGGPR